MTDNTTSSVGPIIFSHPTARQQLLDEHEVVTFRTSKRTTGETWWRESRTGPKQGDATVEYLHEVDPRVAMDLEPHADLSGFNSVRDWQTAIREIHGGLPNRGHLYRATIEE